MTVDTASNLDKFDSVQNLTREEIIKGLECCYVPCDERNCNPCPVGFGHGCALKLKREAVKALKKDAPDTNVGTNDTISRQAAIDALAESMPRMSTPDGSGDFDRDINIVCETIVDDIETIKKLPYAQPKIKPIEYRDCANAMLKMWIDNVLTDGEYYRIMDKLNAFEKSRKARR